MTIYHISLIISEKCTGNIIGGVHIVISSVDKKIMRKLIILEYKLLEIKKRLFQKFVGESKT